MAETIVVSAIVGVVLILAGRSFYRTLSGKNDGCGCESKSCCNSGSCRKPGATKQQQLEET